VLHHPILHRGRHKPIIKPLYLFECCLFRHCPDVAASLPLPATSVAHLDISTSSASLITTVPLADSKHTIQEQLPEPSQHRVRMEVDGKALNSAAAANDSRDADSAPATIPVAAKRGSVVGTSPTCPRCGKNVYFAEMIQGPGGSKYHKLCFRCSDCDKSLDSMNSCVTSENILLCKTCYSKKHGPVGFGWVPIVYVLYVFAVIISWPDSGAPLRVSPKERRNLQQHVKLK
jgi:hypothetical protein